MRAETLGDRTMRVAVAAAVDADESHVFRRSCVQPQLVGSRGGLDELAVLGAADMANRSVMDQRAKLRDQKHQYGGRG